MNKLLAIILTIALVPELLNAANISSPDGRLAVEVGIDGKGSPVYKVELAGHRVIDNSHLGFNLLDAVPMTEDFELINQSEDTVDETWQPVWGEESEIRNHYNELVLNLLQHSTGRRVDLRFRVFDDGVGFRYEFPAPQPDFASFIITDELTEFAIPCDAVAYWIPGDYDSQEFNYTRCHLSEIRSKMDEAHLSGPVYPTPSSPTGVQTALMLKYDDGLYV
ncbi:MAG: glycoside hydrolase family 97 N-terminal domain-containing protein, partial [Muribaculaceae bacterium]|nr:glycoside hydrolase family 97 N-terminal domain-containing protein [Muribaculaceae bacterium]